MTKRPDGALEQDVMRVLWAAGRPLLTSEVRDLLPERLAYTSVATVLSRLCTKGLLDRREEGRAFAYQPSFAESQLAINRIRALYSEAPDKRQVLAGFLGSLPEKDLAAVRALLAESTESAESAE